MLPLVFDNTYARDLPGCCTPWPPAQVPAPRLLYLNDALAVELGLDPAALRADGDTTAALFAGNSLPEGAEPIAQVYAGHQFGGFSPQLGDGRALLLGEVIDRRGRRRDIAFKGSGRTPFSRGGDGKAAVGPMLREALIGEAMQALGIPTTRALAVAATGEEVQREVALPGAVLTRIAASHLRVGTFQFFAVRNDRENLRRLVDYAVARHDPALIGHPDRAHGLLQAVARRQAALIARWMNVGFIHGVMNTDNMAISGETIDYGPCAFLEAYDPQTVFSSIDHGGRYAYGNQPQIARWNLARFAETLLPLIAEAGEAAGGEPGEPGEAAMQAAIGRAMEVVDAFPAWCAAALLAGQRAKLGLAHATPADTTAATAAATATTAADDLADTRLVADWLDLIEAQAVDHTLAWRRLCDAATDPAATALRSLLTVPQALDGWLERWRERVARDDAGAGAGAAAARQARMRAANPALIPRNHRVEAALTAASADGDLGPFERLISALQRPFDEPSAEDADLAEPAAVHITRAYQTFCGT